MGRGFTTEFKEDTRLDIGVGTRSLHLDPVTPHVDGKTRKPKKSKGRHAFSGFVAFFAGMFLQWDWKAQLLECAKSVTSH